MAFVGEEDVGVLAERWVKRVFLIPIKLPISKRETNFLASSGGKGWYGGRVEWRDLIVWKIWNAR